MNGKIIITGTTCTGKTTLGKKLSDHFSVPQIDLDEYYFLPNWKEKEKPTFIKEVLLAIEGKEKWIVTGNFQSILKDTLWVEATTVIWLDYNLFVILRRYFTRTFRRVFFEEKCCGDNYETWRRTFSKDSLFWWIFKSYWKRKIRMKTWTRVKFPEKEWIIFNNPRETNKYVNTL